MVEPTADHVQRNKQYEHAARAEPLPETVTAATPAYVEALKTVGDETFNERQHHVAGAHLKDMVKAGACGFIELPKGLREQVGEATQTLVNNEHPLVRGTGIRLATAIEMHNAKLAADLDKATRLDQGQSTDNVVFGEVKFRGGREVGGGGADGPHDGVDPD